MKWSMKADTAVNLSEGLFLIIGKGVVLWMLPLVDDQGDNYRHEALLVITWAPKVL